jgi:DNA helicase HerA-like ATPase
VLIREYLEQREPRVLALDPFNDFRGLKTFYSGPEALDFMYDNGPRRARIAAPMTADSIEWASDFFEDVVARGRNFLLVLDETTLWTDQREGRDLRTLVNQGRRLGIRLLFACQRIGSIPGVVLSQSTELVLFKTAPRKRDIDTIREWADEETAEAAVRLKPGECLYLTP